MTPMQDLLSVACRGARSEGRRSDGGITTIFVRLQTLSLDQGLIAGIKEVSPRRSASTRRPKTTWLDNAATATSRRFPNYEHQEHFLASPAGVAQLGKPLLGPGEQLR
ncbi:hypothetical protein [Mesorhizobium sp. B4-1-1]|uniref:hypothetical protein n=1 Tax=Mesorhizobium sp. B4-1-1 TaxID=2589890 RepID=UPI001129A26E|nr:hypothetical protein FJW10_06385 [Mesorhizobium sp. B4-1-1]